MEKQTLSPAKQSLSPELHKLALPAEDLRKLASLFCSSSPFDSALRAAQGDLRSSKLVLGLSTLGSELVEESKGCGGSKEDGGYGGGGAFKIAKHPVTEICAAYFV